MKETHIIEKFIDYTESVIEKWKYDEDRKIIVLLIMELVFIDGDENVSKIYVNCSDVFTWGCFDFEPISYSEINELYEYYKKDKDWGCAIWCTEKRNMLPQKPLYDKIHELGIWNLDEMNLEPNPRWSKK